MPTPAGLFTTEDTAVTYRNIEEILPTRRIAAGAIAWELTPAVTPLDARYRFDDATHSIADFVARTDTTGLLILKGD